MTRVSFQVLIIDDDIIEGTELFTLSVDTSVLPVNARLATPRGVSVTIMDNDCKSYMTKMTNTAIGKYTYIHTYIQKYLYYRAYT